MLGLDSNKSLETINTLIYENFVDCEIFKEWLEEKTLHDVEVVKSMGKDYLMSMIQNYNDK